MGRTQVKRAYKYRSCPTQQRQELLRTFGCVREVYDLALEAGTRAWFTEQRRVNYTETSKLLTEWKRSDESPYLGEVSSLPLQQAMRHLQTAFSSFFDKRAQYPTFEARKTSRQSAEYTRSAFKFRNGRLRPAKMSEPLATPSTGEKITNPKHERRARKRLAKTQRVLARKQKGSNDRAKARRKAARVHAWIADLRRDHLHKVTTRLVRENQAVVIGDLQVRTMLGNGKLARVISDAAWRESRTVLEYKAAWYGREVIAFDRWLPSSKTCSTCGGLAESMPLHIRTWTCSGRGATHDRDVNAAANIRAAGLAVSACGAGVRPQRDSSRTGRSAAKQELSGASPMESPAPGAGRSQVGIVLLQAELPPLTSGPGEARDVSTCRERPDRTDTDDERPGRR